MKRSKPTNPVPAALLEFVLRHMRVRTEPGSLQQCEDGSAYCGPRTLDDTNLIFVTRGRVSWWVGGEEHELGRGMLMMSPRRVRHKLVCRTRRVTLLSMHLMPMLPGGQDAFDVLRPPVVQIVHPGCRLDFYLRSAMREYRRDDRAARTQALHAWAALVTMELLRHDAEAGLLTARPMAPVVADVLERLEARVGVATRLEDLCEISGYTGQHLNRLFRRTLGVTPLQHLTHLRMQHAAALLTDRHLPLGAIAARIAMDDPYYFSRAFKQHFGKSPSRYRRESDS